MCMKSTNNPSTYNQKSLREYVVDSLHERVNRYSRFCDALVNCDKVKVRMSLDETSFIYQFFFMMPGMPILVANGTTDPPGTIYAPLYYSVDWSALAYYELPYNGSTPDTDEQWLRNYYHQQGYRISKRFMSATGMAFAHLIMGYDSRTSLTMTIRELYSTFGACFDLDGEQPAGWRDAPEVMESLSETTWPELQGYNTQYIDNIGIFVPSGYVVNDALTQAVIAEAERLAGDPSHNMPPTKRQYEILQRCAVLDRAVNFNNVQDFGNLQAVDMYENVPVVGMALNFGEAIWNWNNKETKRMFWPRAYAFGRNNKLAVFSYDEVVEMHDWYYNSVQTKLHGPVILRPDKGKLERMMSLLTDKGYI